MRPESPWYRPYSLTGGGEYSGLMAAVPLQAATILQAAGGLLDTVAVILTLLWPASTVAVEGMLV